MAAKLIAIEGLDGSGKETQTRLLRNALESIGYKVGSVSFPQYGKPSAALAEDYLHGGFGEHASDVNAYAASSFFAMDRLVSYLKSWRFDYEDCDYFIADRYITSNAIHQCSKLPRAKWGEFVDWLIDYEHGKLGLPAPDKVIYLRLNLDVSQRLLEKRYGGDVTKRDVHERDLEYLERSRRAAEWCCMRMGWIPVECARGGELRERTDVHAEVMRFLGCETKVFADDSVKQREMCEING